MSKYLGELSSSGHAAGSGFSSYLAFDVLHN